MNNLDKQYQSLLQDILDNGDEIIFREKLSYCNNFILKGKVINQTHSEYIISCENYPFISNKEVIIKKPKNNMIWFIYKTSKK